MNVLRINVNGIGFSHDGVNGPYQTAWTLDGRFVADFITTGVLDATLIKTGTLDGTNFICVNLNAVNASISGSLKAQEDENNYIYIDGGHVQAIANGNRSLRIGPYTQGGQTVGNALLMTDSQERTRGILYMDTDHDRPGLSLYDENGVLAVSLYNAPPSGASSYLRLYDTDSPSNTYAVLGANGIWFYDPSASGAWGGIIAGITSANGIFTDGDLIVRGNKNRAIVTKDGLRLLNAYETAEPYFGDIGEGTIGENGKAVVKIDSIFKQTVDLEGYHVFIQKYGAGDCWVERQKSQFTVHGTPGLAFGWELKAHQIDHNGKRLDKYEVKK